MDTLTRKKIQALDGPALSRLAYTLGLAPPGTVMDREVDHRNEHGTPAVWMLHHWDTWEPHKRLDQADAVFRLLREHGWMTSVYWWAGFYGQGGEVIAERQYHGQDFLWQFRHVNDEEAFALLLVAVLAMCSQRSVSLQALSEKE